MEAELSLLFKQAKKDIVSISVDCRLRSCPEAKTGTYEPVRLIM